MQVRFEFLILGGGLAGLAVAAALAPHRRLCLVEREAWLCRHASGRAAAMFIPTYGGPVVSRLARASRGLLAPDLLEPRAALHLASEETDLAAVQQWGRGRRIDAAEIAAVKKIYGGAAELTQVSRPLSQDGARDVRREMHSRGCDDVLLVAPLSVFEKLAGGKTFPLRAEMKHRQFIRLERVLGLETQFEKV